MRSEYIVKRKKYLDLGEFLKRNKGMNFDNDFFVEACEDKKSIYDEIKIFEKNLKKKHQAFEVNALNVVHFDRFLIYKTKLLNSEPESVKTISKEDIRKNLDAFENVYAQSLVRWHQKTSGTSGLPLDVYYDHEFYLKYFYTTLIKTAMRAGVKKLGERDHFSVFLTDNSNYSKSVYPFPGNLLGPHYVLKYSIEDSDISEVVNFINTYNPEVLSSKPNILRNLLDFSKRQNVKNVFNPKLIVSSGAMLDNQLRKELQEFYKTKVVSSYNITEVGHVGSECSHQFIHVDAEKILIECVDEFDQRVADASEGDLVFSSCTNKAMPLLRYKTGDRGVLMNDECQCGESGLRIFEIKGRKVIQFFNEDGGKFSPTIWMHIYSNFPWLEKYQITQKTIREFEVKIEIKEGDEKMLNDLLKKAAISNELQSYFLKDVPWATFSIFFNRFEKDEKFSQFRCEVEL
jgi:phenylacetate-CoA ligase